MYFLALAVDYDGTIAENGNVTKATHKALQRLRESGRKLLLVTGRELPDLRRVMPDLDVFDLVVAENGALLYNPLTKEETALAPPAPPAFIERLKAEKVEPLSIGRSIVATWEPNETIVLEAIRDLGLEHHIIFNKGAVMVLPPNVNKATGLGAALQQLNLSRHNVVGMGDAENDNAFLMACGCAVAVANALPTLKEKSDYVTQKPRGAGVVEIIDRLIENDLCDIAPSLMRHRLLLGKAKETGRGAFLNPHAGPTLIAGISGGGKSTIVAGLLERIVAQDFTFCVVDPEGDYDDFKHAISFGSAKQAPQIEEALELLAGSGGNVVINLLGLDVADRPRLFADFLPRLASLRARTGRPQWLVVDEAHHMLPESFEPARLTIPQGLPASMFVTVHPKALSPHILSRIETMIVVGNTPQVVFDEFAKAIARTAPQIDLAKVESGHALIWRSNEPDHVVEVVVEQPKGDRQRHARKYVEGELGEDRSFYFRGPDKALNLRAQNLMLFVQMAQGVDDGTFLHHLRAGDYSNWFRDVIKDDELADEAKAVEADQGLDAAMGKARIKDMIDRRYTGPAQGAG